MTDQELPRVSPWYEAYVAGVCALAAVTLWVVGLPLQDEWAPVLVVSGLVLLSGFYAQYFIAPRSWLSISLAVNVAAYMLFGTDVATWSAGLGIGLAMFWRYRSPRQALFNASQMIVAVALAAETWNLLRPGTAPIDLVTDLLPILAAAGVRVVVNYSLIIFHNRLSQGTPLLMPWSSRQTAFYFASYALMACMGVLSALLYQAQPWATLLLAGPLLMAMGEANALTRANRLLETLNNTLEQKVAERTAAAEEAVALLGRRLDESTSLQVIGAALVQELDLQRVLEMIGSESVKVTGADAAFVALLPGQKDRLRIRAVHGVLLGQYLNTDLPLGQSVAGEVLRCSCPIVANDAASDPRLYWDYRESGIQAVLEVPLKVGGESFGVLGVVSIRKGVFDDDHVRVMSALGNQAAIAIHNAQLFARGQKVAVFEERARIARDLHDSVTQSLFSIVLNAEAARQVVRKNPEKAEELTRRLGEIGQEALAEMRSLIFELRPQSLREKGLGFALQNHARLFERRQGVEVDLEVEHDLNLTPEVEAAFYRVAQEALTNVGKHARASHAAVTVRREGDATVLEVADDGAGFDAGAMGEGSVTFGIRGMHERLQSVGGTLTVSSTPGGGTRVRAEVPDAAVAAAKAHSA